MEFERAVEKIHTHTPYCPKCNNQITRVVLRRKIIRKERASSVPSVEEDDQPRALLGCLACFSVFIPSEDRLNPFRIFGKQPTAATDAAVEGKPVEKSSSQVPAGTSPVEGVYVPLLHATEVTQVAIDVPGETASENAGTSTGLDILRCIVYGGLMESIASLSIVSSAAASDATTRLSLPSSLSLINVEEMNF